MLTRLSKHWETGEALPPALAAKHGRWAERVCHNTQVLWPPLARSLLSMCLKLRPHSEGARQMYRQGRERRAEGTEKGIAHTHPSPVWHTTWSHLYYMTARR